jgi:hypothetical protein
MSQLLFPEAERRGRATMTQLERSILSKWCFLVFGLLFLINARLPAPSLTDAPLQTCIHHMAHALWLPYLCIAVGWFAWERLTMHVRRAER